MLYDGPSLTATVILLFWRTSGKFKMYVYPRNEQFAKEGQIRNCARPSMASTVLRLSVCHAQPIENLTPAAPGSSMCQFQLGHCAKYCRQENTRGDHSHASRMDRKKKEADRFDRSVTSPAKLLRRISWACPIGLRTWRSCKSTLLRHHPRSVSLPRLRRSIGLEKRLRGGCRR